MHFLLRLSLVTLVFLSSCNRQFARVQPTPGVHYQALASPDKAEKLPTVSPVGETQSLADEVANVTQKQAASEPEVVASAKPAVALPLHPSLAKKMNRIQKQLMTVSVSGKNKTAVNRATKTKKATDSKGTMSIVGLSLGVVGLVLMAAGAPLGILLAIPGLIFSIIGLKGSNRGVAIAGVVVNALAIALLIIIVIAVATLGFT